VSTVSHVFTVVLLLMAAETAGAGWIFMGAVLLAFVFLVYEHTLVTPTDQSRLGKAFFTVNGYISIGLLLLGILDWFVLPR